MPYLLYPKSWLLSLRVLILLKNIQCKRILVGGAKSKMYKYKQSLIVIVTNNNSCRFYLQVMGTDNELG